MEKVCSSVSSLPTYYVENLSMKVTDRKTGNIVENGDKIVELLQALLAALGQGTAPLLMFCLQLEADTGETEHAYLHLDGMISETIAFSAARTEKDGKKAKKILLQLLDSTSMDLGPAKWVAIELYTSQINGHCRVRYGIKKANGTWQLSDNWLDETSQSGWFSRMLSAIRGWRSRR